MDTIISNLNTIGGNFQAEEILLAARAIGIEKEMFDLMNQVPSFGKSVKLKIMVKKIMSLNKITSKKNIDY